jgi:6-bladed beta-propeller
MFSQEIAERGSLVTGVPLKGNFHDDYACQRNQSLVGIVVGGGRAAGFVCLLLLATLGPTALAQPDTQLDQSAQAFKVQHVASFTGPGNLRRTLPPKAKLALDIVAGKPDLPPKEDEMQPIAIVTDSLNRLLVADNHSMAVHIFDFARHKYSDVKIAESGMQSIAAIAVDDGDRIYATDPRQGKIFIFNPNGKFLGYLQRRKEQEYMAPVGIAIDRAHGYIYVCDRDRNMVIKVSQSGHVLQHFGRRGGGSGPGDFLRPTQVALAGDEIFVLDSGNRRIQQLNSEGKFLAETKIAEGAGLAVDRRKRILISEPTIHRVAVYRDDGQLVTTFGGEGSPQDDSLDPSGLWLKSDHCLYVADKANKRVELFQVTSSSGKSCH